CRGRWAFATKMTTSDKDSAMPLDDFDDENLRDDLDERDELDGDEDDGLDAELLERASLFGITAEQAGSRFKDNDSLFVARDVMIDPLSAISGPTPQTQQRTLQNPPPAEEPLFSKEDLEELGPELSKVLQRLTERYDGKLKQLNEELEAARNSG